MRKIVVVLVVLAVVAGGYVLMNRSTSSSAQPAGGAAADGRPGGGGPGGANGAPGGGMAGGMFARPPMTVDIAKVSRAPVSEQLELVGNLIGEATVDVVPKTSGRLQNVLVRLGDRVGHGQLIALVEDREVLEQVKQAQASYQVQEATIRQREADLKFAETNVERSRNLFNRQLLPRQSLDDNEARYQAAVAQLDLARAQFEQASARLEELKIALVNTKIVSPVDGFVGKRHLDPGAWVSQNSPVVSVVAISTVRLVVNLVEKDLRRVTPGVPADVEVDAYPGETFKGRVARVAPVLDPATRTAEVEIEIPNPTYRLKPGMYSRVRLTVAERANALVVPRNALVDLEGRRGVFLIEGEGRTATFRAVDVGLQDTERAEITNGLAEGQAVITTGAAALRDGDPIVLPGAGGPRGQHGPGLRGNGGAPGQGSRAAGPGGAQGGGRTRS